MDIRAGQRTAPAATCGEGHARSHRIRRPLTSLESWEQMADNELEGRTQHPTSHTVKEAPPLSVRAGPRGEGLTLPLQARASGPGPAGLPPRPLGARAPEGGLSVLCPDSTGLLWELDNKGYWLKTVIRFHEALETLQK